MGGSGGIFGGGYDPSRYKEIIGKTREETLDSRFESEVSEILDQILAESHRDTETTREHLDEVKEIIEQEDIGSIEMRFGGSVSKHTYVDGLSDVDVLLILDRTELSDASPPEVLDYVKTILSDSKSRNIDEVSTGKLAVTVRFTDGEEIQLLPAVKRGEGYRISDQNGENWSNVIRPDRFAEKLTEVNQDNGGKAVPVVKLAKSIISELPEGQQLSGYHVESIAIEAFKSYPDDKPKTSKAMLRHFFENAKDVIRSPIKDKTNQSMNVDEYLGPENSAERIRMGYAIDRIGRRMKKADEIGSVDEWKSILGV